jgi:hypothetical protein
MDCGDCGVHPGQLHKAGCDIEQCPLCGRQRMSCSCVYVVNGLDPSKLETEHPDLYEGGPTDAMHARCDEEIQQAGGPLPWSGTWPGEAECREFGWWAKRNPNGPGWVRCAADDPKAQPDLNRLGRDATWSRALRRYVLKT